MRSGIAHTIPGINMTTARHRQGKRGVTRASDPGAPLQKKGGKSYPSLTLALVGCRTRFRQIVSMVVIVILVPNAGAPQMRKYEQWLESYLPCQFPRVFRWP